MPISETLSDRSSYRPSKVEGIKEQSNFLREPIAKELLEDTKNFSEDGIQILKFHGSYQQDNRDNRSKGQEKNYQFMLRTRSPGGFIPPQLYLTLDQLSDKYGNGTIRATTRQGFQLHGVLKQNLKTVLAAIVKNMGSTLGACGDLNRNVMAPPAPYKNRPDYQYARTYANNIADLLTPQTGAYYEIWLDGEVVISGEEDPEVKAARQRNTNGTIFPDSVEPIYGTHYLPRKFKISLTVPGDNSVDIYTQDLSLVVITNPSGELEGFDVFAGGGQGRTHNKEDTFARLADEICYVPKEDIYDFVKAIVATQRDYGDRFSRRHSRMKYLLNDWGVDRFKTKLQDYFGKPLEAFRPLPEWKYQDFLGWHEQGDGKLFLGISIDNGRIKNEDGFQLKTALREIVQKYNLPMLVTPHQNVLVYDISPSDQGQIQQILAQYGIQKEMDIDPLVRYAMACPALPTCGLAITESERAIPDILKRIRTLLAKVGLGQEHFVVRMTGCPNGCARPYVAELGFVGSAPDAYQLWLGGSPNQTRLARPYLERVATDEIERVLEPILVNFKRDRKSGESFGDWCDRIGFESIRHFVNNYSSYSSMNIDTQEKEQNFQRETQVAQSYQSPTGENGQAAASGTVAPLAQTTQSSVPSEGEPQEQTDTSKMRHRVSVRDEIYNRMKTEAKRQGKPLVQIATEAFEEYLKRFKSEE